MKTAFILGAGLGTRLRPLTEHCPKPLIEVGGKPIICRAFDALIAAGIGRFIVNTHHAADCYKTAFPKSEYHGVPITFVHETVLLDTGGGLKNIEPLLSDEDESIAIYNGDILANLDLKRLFAFHRGNDALATLLLRTDSCGNVNFDDCSSRVCDMRDRLGVAGTRRCRFTGIYCVRRAFFKELVPGKTESVVEAFLRTIARSRGIAALVDDGGSWQDLGTIGELEKARRLFI
ncbi:MAG: NTP transferase domain-containing protein [Opitutales bacterium]|nr:NTP transferase domain-containing protein [Opitutales bacterium]